MALFGAIDIPRAAEPRGAALPVRARRAALRERGVVLAARKQESLDGAIPSRVIELGRVMEYHAAQSLEGRLVAVAHGARAGGARPVRASGAGRAAGSALVRERAGAVLGGRARRAVGRRR